jgi:hypothetical protein
MIITYIYGGLGNQMFQYAIGRKLSLLHHTELKLNTNWFQTEITGTSVREYELHHFNLNAQFATNDDLIKVTDPFKNPFLRRAFFKWQSHKPYYKRRLIEEKHFHFDENVLKAGKSASLTGYWQSEKYFLDIQETLRKDFVFREPLDGKNKEIAELIKNTQSVSLHVRRKHYVPQPPLKEVHGTCPPEYIFSTIQYMRQKVSNPVYFIFSDDIQWCNENLELPGEKHFIDFNAGKCSFRDMQLMSLCKHNIIANSSFSWWAAWLNEHKDKIVIAPVRWFIDTSKNTKDLFPESWIRI